MQGLRSVVPISPVWSGGSFAAFSLSNVNLRADVDDFQIIVFQSQERIYRCARIVLRMPVKVPEIVVENHNAADFQQAKGSDRIDHDIVYMMGTINVDEIVFHGIVGCFKE